MSGVDRQALAAGADRCVACGLCVPQCPTWQTTRNEAHSPRGRITLMAALAAGSEPDGAGLHLDACLGCGRCETACPNDVPYLAMLPRAKALAPGHPSLGARTLGQLAGRRWGGLAMRLLLRLVGLARVLRIGPLLPARLGLALAAAPASSRAARLPALAAGKDADAQVTLFTGCFGAVVDADTLAATHRLLLACGYEVAVPQESACCGAIAEHAGQLDKSEACGRRSRQTYAAAKTVAYTASGCGVQLVRSRQLASEVVDAGDLIAQRAERLRFKPAQGAAVLVHEPCTQQQLPDGGSWVARLLERIPGLEVSQAPANDTCCGAGGLTYLTHTDNARTLSARKIDAVMSAAGPAPVLVSTNYGCRLLLAAAARKAGKPLRIIHPLVLAAEHLVEQG